MATKGDLLHSIARSSIDDILLAVRRHLRMDIAFVGRFIGDRRVVRFVSLDEDAENLLKGASHTLVETYCQLLAEGAVPPIIPDTFDHPVLREMRITQALRIRSYIGVPVELSDGQLYGTLCCVGHEPGPHLDEGGLEILHFAASYIAQQLEGISTMGAQGASSHDEIAMFLGRSDVPEVVHQPVVRLGDGKVVGYEALARFPSPDQAPAGWFVAAHAMELGVALEHHAAALALQGFLQLPDDVYLAINLGARALVALDLSALLVDVNPRRIVIELTEHDDVLDLALAEARRRVAAVGARFAIDDIGAGFAGLTRLVDLRPDVVKLDRALVRGIEHDPARQALAAASVVFNQRVGSDLVAEGVELPEEAAMLRELGVGLAQGFHLGRPDVAPWLAA